VELQNGTANLEESQQLLPKQNVHLPYNPVIKHIFWYLPKRIENMSAQ
jgi:hypothetical protein